MPVSTPYVNRHMILKLIVFDIYKTLLHVGPERIVHESEWDHLWNGTFPGSRPPMDYPQFKRRVEEEVQSDHQKAVLLGVQYPEVFWEDLMCRILPPLKSLDQTRRKDFIYRQIQLERGVSLMEGADEALASFKEKDLLMGVASNAQDYTFSELDTCLAKVGLDRSLFNPRFCFWSFMNGFSKPNPHVFRILSARAMHVGIQPDEILMVGDRIDNDLIPAQKHGWHTWHLNLQTGPSDYQGGDWSDLMKYIEIHCQEGT